jgi:hypothetical protein
VGSPAINHPFEFAFLINILRGRLQSMSSNGRVLSRQWRSPTPNGFTPAQSWYLAGHRRRSDSDHVSTWLPVTSRSQGLVGTYWRWGEELFWRLSKGEGCFDQAGDQVLSLPTDASEFNKLLRGRRQR